MLLDGIEILQVAETGAPDISLETIDFAGQMALRMGAIVITGDAFAVDGTFLGRGKLRDSAALDDPVVWASKPDCKRILLVAGCAPDAAPFAGVAAVLLQADPLASEATWFAESAIADLLGDPERAPIIPRGHYAAGTASYAVLAALCSLATKLKRFNQPDIALLDGAGALAWVNWKAAAAGDMGEDICRQGDKAEWPVIPCKDGHVALVFNERDWQPLVKMIGDARLADEKYNTFKGRAIHRDEYMQIIREWALGVTKQVLIDLFLEYQIPAAPVLTEADLLEDRLLIHRGAFIEAHRPDGRACKTPELAHRIVRENRLAEKPQRVDGALPLAGLRVLDLGIITAGAGVGGLLADLGAEVLKIESETYPDPFRQWAGDTVSPLFKCNNRNKYGLAIDLKSEAGKAQFAELAKSADLVLENFRRGVLDRLGFDFATLKSINPRIVLASISSQGLDGPGSEATSFGSTLEASSGFAANACYADGLPHITGRNLNYPDQTVVLYAAAVLTAALADRRTGMQIDVSQRDVAIFLAGESIEQLTAGEPLVRRENGACHASIDGAWIAVAESIDPEWIAGRTADDAVAELRSRGISAARVNRGSDMLRKYLASYQLDRSPNGDLVKGFPFQFQKTPMTIRLNSPDVGEHTKQFVKDTAR